jgi:hypothetical protein
MTEIVENKIYFVIFNSCFHKHKKGSISLTPSADSLKKILDMNENIIIHLVDMEYSDIRQARLDVEANEYNMLDDKDTVDEIIFEKGAIEEVENMPEYGEKVEIVEEFLPFTKNRYTGKNVIYLCYNNDENNDIKDEYDLMHFTEDYFSHKGEKKAYIVNDGKEEEDLVSLMDDFLKDKIPLPYNPWRGEKMMKRKDNILSLYKEGIIILIHYLSAGFHLYDKNDKDTDYPRIWIPSWCFNVEIPYLKGIIYYYHLISDNEVHRPDMEICQNAEYRQTLTQCLVHILSNFLVNNGYVRKDTKNWYDVTIYENVLNKI